MWDLTEPFKSSQADEAVEGEEHVLSHVPSQQLPLLSLVYPSHADLSLSLYTLWVHVSARQSRTEKGLSPSLGYSHGLKVGIISRGHLGKQLACASLMLTWTLHPSIHVSTSRPEEAEACVLLQQCSAGGLGGRCVPLLSPTTCAVCSIVQPAIQKPCIVSSLVTAIPLLRVNAEWLVAIFYIALNSSMLQNLLHQKTQKLPNNLCFPECCPICAEQKTSYPWFVCKSFVSKGFPLSMTQEE
ncbi:unnamed protein product [Bubo scandiacus]